MDKSIEERLAELEKRVAVVEEAQPDEVVIILMSQEMDRVMSAFIIANAALAFGYKVTMFFTLWGLVALRQQKIYSKKDWSTKMMMALSPSDLKDLPLSKLNFLGLGAKFMSEKMRKKNILSLDELRKMAIDTGANLVACDMSRELMDIEVEELIPEITTGNVATFLAKALESRLLIAI